MEKLRWELEQLLTAEDRLLILILCETCEHRTATHNRPESWTGGQKSFEII
jgi:CRISPR-associated protein Cas2